MDRGKVIKGLEICRHRVISQENCMECPYIYDRRSKQSNCEGVLHWDALALLKEDCHNCKLECLLQKYDELKEKYDKLLREQTDENKELRSMVEFWKEKALHT